MNSKQSLDGINLIRKIIDQQEAAKLPPNSCLTVSTDGGETNETMRHRDVISPNDTLLNSLIH